MDEACQKEDLTKDICQVYTEQLQKSNLYERQLYTMRHNSICYRILDLVGGAQHPISRRSIKISHTPDAAVVAAIRAVEHDAAPRARGKMHGAAKRKAPDTAVYPHSVSQNTLS